MAEFMDWAGQTLLAVTALIVLVLLARRPVARLFGARAAFLLWSLPLVRLLTPGLTLPRPDWMPALPSHVGEAVQEGANVPGAPQPMIDAPLALDPASVGGLDLLLALPALWLAGTLIVVASGHLRQTRFLDRMLSTSRAPNATEARALGRACELVGLERTPRLLVSSEASGPMVTRLRLGQPLVILPEGTEPGELHHTFMHECTHIRRRDLSWQSLFNGARAILWFHPLGGLARRAFRSDQEAACDADVVRRLGGERASYAESLLAAARKAHTYQDSGAATPWQQRWTGEAAMALTLHHPLKERLMLLNRPSVQPRPLTRGGAAACALLAVALAAPVTFADDPAPQAAPTVTSKSVIKRILDGETTRLEIGRDGDVTTIVRIDELGNRIPISETELDRLGIDIDLTGLEGLDGLKALEGLKSLETLGGLGSLGGLAALGQLGDIGEMSNVRTIVVKAGDLDGTNVDAVLTDDVKGVVNFTVPDTTISADDVERRFVWVGDSADAESRLEAAQRMLESVERMLEDTDDADLQLKLEAAREAVREARDK